MGILEDIKQERFDSNVEMAIVNLLYTSNWLRDEQRRTFEPHGIRSQHYNILRILKGRHPEPASPGEIKEVMLDKAPDLTRLLDKLENLGFIDRHLCENNRRKMDVLITPKGEKALNQLNKETKREVAKWKQNLSEREAKTLSDLLDKVRL